MARSKGISGFPELLPEEFALELQWRQLIQNSYSRFGYVPIETPAVEELTTLLGQSGDTDKEVYAVVRYSADDPTATSRFGLHYDLTVPLARYVEDRRAQLRFPFKRQQTQKAWRGERPQDGRYREFVQSDIDVIAEGNLSPDFESEVPVAILASLAAIGVTRINFAINDRRILEGAYRAIGINDVVTVIRILDKFDKLPAETIEDLLRQNASLDAVQARKCIQIASIRTADLGFVEQLKALGIAGPELDAGIASVTQAFLRIERNKSPETRVFVDLSVARGFDYYTGVVFEGRFQDYPSYPAICSGGRYDKLVGSASATSLPGVGGSIGLTRIFQKLLKEGELASQLVHAHADVLIARFPDDTLESLDNQANALRARGIRVEIYFEAEKLTNQLRYADRKGIRFLLLPAMDGSGLEVRDLTTREQQPIDLATWSIPQGAAAAEK